MADPLATIVVTTCDRPHLAGRAVASALAQTEPRIEVVVIDDGARVPFHARVSDPRLRIVRTAGRVGVNAARNQGLAVARGRWITFLDDDDVLLPQMVERASNAARTSPLPPPVAVISGLEEVGPEGTVTLTRRPVSMARGRHYFLEDVDDPADRRGLAAYNTLLAPVEVLREVGGFDEEMKAWMHLDLMLRLNPVCSIQAVREVGYRMYHHGDERLSRRHIIRAQAMTRTYRKHRALFRQHPQMRSLHLGRTGLMYLRGGRWVRPVVLTARSFVGDPRRPRAVRDLLLALAGPHVLRWRSGRRIRQEAGSPVPQGLPDSSRERR